MKQRILWSGLAAAVAAAALASPASAAHLVFDVTITDIGDVDLNGVETDTAANLQFIQTFYIAGLPPAGTSVYQTINLGNVGGAENYLQAGGPVTWSGGPAAFVGPPAPLTSSGSLFGTGFGWSRFGGLSFAPQYSLFNGGQLNAGTSYGTFSDDFTHFAGSDVSVQLSYNDFVPVDSQPADPPPFTVGQMLGSMAGETWTYTFMTDAYDAVCDDVSCSGYSNTRFYNGTATLDVSQSSLTPEPQAWALMILGFGAVGAALRRRRRWRSTASFPAAAT